MPKKMYEQRRWTVPTPPSIKLVSTKLCKIVTEMCVFVSPRSYAVRSRPRVRQQQRRLATPKIGEVLFVTIENEKYFDFTYFL